MKLKTRLRNKTFQFSDVKEVLAKANEEKSGDRQAGIAASSETERVAAKMVLSELPLAYLKEHPVVSYDEDVITRVNHDSLDVATFQSISDWSVAKLREHILDDATSGENLQQLGRALTAETIAACAKIMTNLDLIVGAKKIHNVVRANTTLGLPGRLSVRVQPNHPTDDTEGILAATREGISFGCGDALIGVNPVTDDVSTCERILNATWDFIRQHDIPSQNCVLAHVSTQMKALEKGARMDVIFQSLAGSEDALNAFGTSMAQLDEAADMIQRLGTAAGPNRMYFETGQGSELSSGTHHGADQVTLEARCYALARRYNPFMVNTVVGFIGPEYLRDARQVTRAGLEDNFMGKLSGLPMGCDACYTNHMDADQNDLENLAVLLASAGTTFFMGLPMGDDVMLNYQSTSFHDNAAIRDVLGLRPAPELEEWLVKKGLMEEGRLTSRAGDASLFV